MMEPYDLEMQESVMAAAAEINYSLKKGVYLALQGPSLETRAEYAFLHKIGADMVGMSSVPEVIVANHAGIKVAMISMISNVCYPIHRISKTTVEEVIAVAQQASPVLHDLIIKALHNTVK